jgi:flagellar biosynthetic protein FliR
MVIGATAQLIAIGIGLAGDVIAGATGLQLAQAADPSSGQMVPQLSRLITLLVTALMLSLGGHRLVLDALLGSFQAMPPLSVSLDASTLTAAVDHLSIGVSAGLHVAAPVVGCVLLSNVAVALVSRVAPQINVLAVGMNLNLLAALIVTALAIGSAGLAFEHELTRSLASLNLGGR